MVPVVGVGRGDALFGNPSDPLGWVRARFPATIGPPWYRAMAAELRLRPDDDLLDVGCGSAGARRARPRPVKGPPIDQPKPQRAATSMQRPPGHLNRAAPICRLMGG
jgi:hypothetical protein